MSDLESTFAWHWEKFGTLPPECEYHFARPRRFRFDFAWPVQKVAVEIEGGVFVGGGHTRGAGYTKNCEKYNLAAELGWRVLRYTVKHLEREPVQVIEQIVRVLNQ